MKSNFGFETTVHLYKYMESPRELFTDGFIRASQLSVLNDPFEALYCKKGLNELSNHFDNPKIFDNGKKISFSSYIEKYKERIGVISLTEDKSSHLMWAHYANNHHGICVGFNLLDGSINGNWIFERLFKEDQHRYSTCWEGYELFNGKPQPIKYRRCPRYQIDKFDYDYSNIDAEGADRILVEVFLQKSDEWLYEKEHRIVLRLEQADRALIFDLDRITNSSLKMEIVNAEWTFFNKERNCYEINLLEILCGEDRFSIASALAGLSKNKKNVYLFKLSSSAIAQCYFGVKNEQLTIDDVKTPYVTRYGYFDLWKAQRDERSYSIKFDEII